MMTEIEFHSSLSNLWAKVAAIWAKFNVTTGHAHSGAADDGKAIHHGDTTGLTDDDHARYFDKDGSKALTGADIKRNVDDSLLQLWGGTAIAGHGANIYLGGSNQGDIPGQIGFVVPNAAKSSHLVVMSIAGVTDTPFLDLGGHGIGNLADPVSVQQAATKNYVDAVGQAWAAWTPTLTWSGATPVSVTTIARWTQIGRVVFFEFQTSSGDSNATTGLTITLPKAHVGTGLSVIFRGIEQAGGSTPYDSDPGAYVSSGGSTIGFTRFVTGTDGASIVIYISGSYEVA